MSVTGAPWLPMTVPDRTRLIPIDRGRVFVVDVGPDGASEDVAGPPLLLLHGLLTTHFAFDRIIPRLASSRRVIAVDLPGTGDSDRPDPLDAELYSPEGLARCVIEVLEAMDVPCVDVVGHDYGGAVALVAAVERPKLVRRLVLSAPLLLHPRVPFEGTLGIAVSLGHEVFHRTVRRADVQRALEQGVCTPELVSESEVNVYWDRLGRKGGREAAHSMLVQLGHVVRLRERFGRLLAPTTLVWGDRDRIVSPEQAERLAALLPGATSIETIEGCGHNPARERPEAMARVIEASTAAPLR